ncbi:MAG TPA: tetratricopeptide repeat protein [bacterium]
MKTITKIAVFVLIWLLLTGKLIYAQSALEEHFSKGIEYAIHGEFEMAKAEFNNALKLDSLNTDIELSLRIVKDALDQKIEKQTAIHFFKGADYAGKQNLDKAIAEISMAIELNPGYAEFYRLRGNTYSHNGDDEQAMVDYNKAIEINPRYDEAYNNRGLAYFNRGDYDQAIADYNKSIEINASNAEVYFRRGDAYYGKGDDVQAIAEYDKAIVINPRYAGAYVNLGLVYAGRGDYEQAIVDYNEAIEIDPSEAKAYNNRGLSYSNMGNYGQAIIDYTKAIEIDPTNAKAYNNRGLAYSDRGDYEQAIVDYNKALELNPGNAPSYYNMGLACEKTGRLKEAVEAYKSFIQNAPSQYAYQIEEARRKIKPHETIKMRISIILVKTKTTAQEIWQKLDAGIDFATLALQYSIGPANEQGGDLGYLYPGDMLAELDSVAVNLKVGQYSPIIESSNGYFILMKTDEKLPPVVRD